MFRLSITQQEKQKVTLTINPINNSTTKSLINDMLKLEPIKLLYDSSLAVGSAAYLTAITLALLTQAASIYLMATLLLGCVN